MTTWELARETDDYWVGAITVTIAGVAVDPSRIKFAVKRKGTRPADADWASPVVNPLGGSDIGVVVNAVTVPAHYGIFASITQGSADLVIEPDEIGWIDRT